MERFAFKIDKTLKANLYKICRLCGIDNPEKVTILGNADDAVNVDDCEPELWRKIQVCIGFTISKDDKMPQTMCSLCVDKINDFFEFREMCFATNVQTRKLLGLKEEKLQEPTVKIKEQTGKLKESTGKAKESLGKTKESLGKNKEPLSKNKEALGKFKEPPIKIKEDLDVKLPIVPPPPLGKRTLFGKGKRKRKADEMLAKTTIKEDVEEIKQEMPSTSASSMPLRKKSKLSSGAVTVSTTTTTTTTKAATTTSKATTATSKATTITTKTSASSAVTNASSTPTATTTTTLKRTKPLTPMQRRALEQAEKKLKPKDEIKDEVIEQVATNNTETKVMPAPVPPKLPPKFTSKFKQLCNICDQRFINKAKLEQHLYATHVPTVPRYFCTACNETMKKGNEIKNHQLWHKLSKTPFVCGLCGEKLLNSYGYSRHLREHIPEVPTAMLVLDRQCPQCQETFATTFLYNIHPCSLKTKKCAGCNRNQKSDVEYIKHASICPKMFINYSKHISAAAVAAESNVRIKNENDVEAAAAAEALVRSTRRSINMTPVVSLTRLSAPLLMQSNQCVLIPGQHVDMNEELQMSPTTSNAKTSKKTNKKGVSRKELKRVDELLKSTMDTLVSIKHEPEVHMDTCEVMPEASAAPEVSTAVEDDAPMEEAPPHSPSPPPADDFHNDSAHDDENESLTGISIKQEHQDESEKVEEQHKNNETNVKQEVPDEDASPNKIPVLKLKITKEHGKLNSSIVQQEDNTRSEKKKKKKKRKDTEKEKERLEPNLEVPREDTPIFMPQPGIVHIKQERMDDDDADAATMKDPTLNHQDQVAMPPLVMTTIPQPLEFKISCIASGVDFNVGGDIDFDEHEDAANDIPQTTVEEQLPCDDEMQDIKPCREALDRLLKITQVSGGVEMSQDDDQIGEIIQQNTYIQQDVEMPERPKKSKAEKSKAEKSKAEKSPNKSKKANRRAVKSTNGAMRIRTVAEVPTPLPQIVAVSSGNDVAADTFSSGEPEHAHVVIKEERLDEGYGDQIQQPENEESQMQTDDAETCSASIQQPSPRENTWNASTAHDSPHAAPVASEYVATEDDEPEDGEQEDGAPEGVEPEHASPGHASPEHASPDHASPEHASSEHASSEHSSSEHASPEHASSEHASPEHASSEHASPEHASSEHASPEHASSEHASPEHASVEHASSEHASSEHASPEHASSEHGLAEHQELSLDKTNCATTLSPQQEELHLEKTNWIKTSTPQPKDFNLDTASCGNALSDTQKLSEEQAYIANIDFNNIVIKQEKDIEVSEVELNESITHATMLSNGLISRQKRHRTQPMQQLQHDSMDQDDQDMDDDDELDEGEEEEDDEEDEEEEEDEDDEDEEECEDDEQDEEFEEEREYRELELPPMLVDNVDAMPSMISIESTVESKAEQEHQLGLVGCNVEPLNEHVSRSPLMLISSVVSGIIESPHSPVSLEAPAVVDKSTQHQPQEAAEVATFNMPPPPPPQFKILSVVSESVEAAFEPSKQPEVIPAYNIEDATSSAEVTAPDTICGAITQDIEADLAAQPFFEPQPPVSTINDAAAMSTETSTMTEHLDTYEELQNQLNHEMMNEQSMPIMDDTQATHNSFALETLTTLPVPIEEAHHTAFEAMPPVFSCNISSGLSTTDTPTTSSQAAAPPSPKLNEETENLMNESNDAAVRFQTNTALLTQQPLILHNNNNNNLLLDDDSNINEIAENNNNANIERELQDDSLGTNERLNLNVSVEQPTNGAEVVHLIDLT